MNNIDIFEDNNFGTAIDFLKKEQTLEGLVSIVGTYLDGLNWKGPEVFAVGTPKGGTGKSVTAINLAHSLASRGLKVGYVDLDVDDPNGIRYTHGDFDFDGNSRLDFSLVEVVVGKKGKGKKPEVHKLSLGDVAIRSRSKIRWTFYL